MSIKPRNVRKEERLLEKQLRKDRLIQTRVDRRLQKVLVEQAKQRRISVSNLVRNLLEDALGLGDPQAGPVIDPDQPPLAPLPSLDHVYAWNSVILGRAAECSRCTQTIEAGSAALIGLSEDPTAPRAWLCSECGEDL